MIDPRAIVDPSAIIGDNVSIGPWSIVGPDVEIGDGCELASHVVLKGPTFLAAIIKFFSLLPWVMRPLTLNTKASQRD